MTMLSPRAANQRCVVVSGRNQVESSIESLNTYESGAWPMPALAALRRWSMSGSVALAGCLRRRDAVRMRAVAVLMRVLLR